MNISTNLELKSTFNNYENKINFDDKLFNYVIEYIYLYQEKLDKYDEKCLFNINIDYCNKRINIMSFDFLLKFSLYKDNVTQMINIDGYKYIDKFDYLENKECNDFIFLLIKHINNNFDNIIDVK